MQFDSFNWTGKDFEIGKEVALYTIEVLKRKINGENIAISKSLLEFLKKKVPDRSSNITIGTIGGLLHVPGFFSRIGFDARITIWLKKNPQEALVDLDIIKEKIKNCKNYTECSRLELPRISLKPIPKDNISIKEDDFINTYKEKIQNLKKLDVNEANTKSNLIEPLLKYLNWDIHNIIEVEKEKKVISGNFVDYALKINGKSKIYIEAKKINNNLQNLKDISDAISYTIDDGIEWCLITNGDKLNLYKAREPGDLYNKLVLEINISSNKNLEFLEFFKKERIRKDIFSTELNEIISINKIIKTLENVFSNLNDEFIEYLHGKIRSLTKSQIKEALKNIDTEFINTVLPKEIIVSDEIIEDKEITQISEDVLEIQLPAARSSDIPAWRKYGYLPFPMRYRSFFPGYKIPFTLQTDIGDLTTWITGGYIQDIEGDPKAGTYISKNVTKFFRAHSELEVGHILRITKLEEKSYKLEIIK